MDSNFLFQTASRVIFGIDSIKQISGQTKNYGRKVFIIISQSSHLDDLLREELSWCDLLIVPSHCEPDLAEVTRLSMTARDFSPDCIIGIGGGSAIDIAKAVGAFSTNHHPPSAYLEIVGEARPLENPTTPVIAIPTTAGTGSEVTKNAVIGIPDRKIKVSLRSEKILPKVALIDPKLTSTLNAMYSASTGMDALTQLIEPYLSKKSNPFTDMLCVEGIRRIPGALIKVMENGSDIRSRSEMSYASLLGGMALANAGLGAVHGFAGVLGGMYSAPHGLICARLLPAVFSINYEHISRNGANLCLIDKLNKISSMLTQKRSAHAKEGIDWLYQFTERLGIPKLCDLGIQKGDFPEIVKNAKLSSSMKGNPIELPDEALYKILELSY